MKSIKVIAAGLILVLTAACDNREYKTIVSTAQPEVAAPTRPLLMQKPGTTECTQEFIDASIEVIEGAKNLKFAFESEDFVSPDVVLERADEVVGLCQDLLGNLVDKENLDSCQISAADGPQTEVQISMTQVRALCKESTQIQKDLQGLVNN